MIKESIYQCYSKAAENLPFNIINEQNENVLTRKVKELSESCIFSIGVQTLMGSLALKACGIAFGTSFPILLALVAAKSFISTLNCAKTAIKATLNSAKTVIQITAQKAASPFVRVATAINTIFQKLCASFMSFALSSYDLLKATYPSSFRKFNFHLPPSTVIESEGPIAEVQERVIEEKPIITENRARPRVPSCDSQFMIQEQDIKGGYLLRGLPLDSSKEEIAFLISALGNSIQSPPKPLLLKKGNAPWVFFLEYNLDRPLKESTSKRLATTPTTLKNIPSNLLLEGIPVSLRSKF